VYCCSCLVCIVVVVLVYCCSCLVYCCSCVMCTVVILCVFAAVCVYCCFYFRCRTAGYISQYSEGPATSHLDTGFSWFAIHNWHNISFCSFRNSVRHKAQLHTEISTTFNSPAVHSVSDTNEHQGTSLGVSNAAGVYSWQLCRHSCVERQSKDGSPIFHPRHPTVNLQRLVMGNLYL